MPQIKALVKKRYRVLAKHYHPDIVQLNHGKYFREWPEYGLSFRLITKTYQWFQKLDAITEPKKFKLGNNVPDEPLPWYLERKPLTLPFGYQETTEYLAYR